MDRIPNRDFLNSLGDAPGHASIRLASGPFRVSLEGLPEVVVRNLERRWRITRGDRVGEGSLVRLQAVRSGVDRFLARPPEEERPEPYRFGYTSRNGDHLFWSYHFASYYSPATGSGKVAFCRFDSPYLETDVENTLRTVLAWKAVEAGGFLLHGAGIRRNRGAHIFFGPSGSGKTTVAGLSPREDVLHDDLCFVVPREEAFLAFGFPFLGDGREDLPRVQVMDRVAGFYRLVKADHVALERIPGAAAAAELVGSLPFVTEHPQARWPALENVARAVARVPVFRLAFRRDASFWDAVEAERRGR